MVSAIASDTDREYGTARGKIDGLRTIELYDACDLFCLRFGLGVDVLWRI
jgi:hypothetical protein